MRDSAKSFANTVVVGQGSIGVFGAAEIAVVADSGEIDFDAAALLDIASGNDRVAINGGGSTGNLYIDAMGARPTQSPLSAKQTWNVFDPVGELAPAMPAVSLTQATNGTYVFHDATPHAQATITGLNAKYMILAEGQTFEFETESLTANFSGPGAVVSDDHDSADGTPRTVLNVAGALRRSRTRRTIVPS